MFFSLLAYIHSSSYEASKKEAKVFSESTMNIAMPVIALALIAVLYVVNVKPISANSTLIGSLQAMNSSNPTLAMDKLEEAYNKSRLGRPEVVEQISANIQALLGSGAPTEKKNEFFNFAKAAVVGQAEELNTDARYQLVAGTFLARTGSLQESLTYFNKAAELIPGKQLVYFETGNALLNLNDSAGALAWFKKAYDLAPEYSEAQAIYLSGSIFARDRALELKLLGEISKEAVIFDDRILSAYYNVGRIGEVVIILEERIKLDPANAATYQEYLKQLRSGQ